MVKWRIGKVQGRQETMLGLGGVKVQTLDYKAQQFSKATSQPAVLISFCAENLPTCRSVHGSVEL